MVRACFHLGFEFAPVDAGSVGASHCLDVVSAGLIPFGFGFCNLTHFVAAVAARLKTWAHEHSNSLRLSMSGKRDFSASGFDNFSSFTNADVEVLSKWRFLSVITAAPIYTLITSINHQCAMRWVNRCTWCTVMVVRLKWSAVACSYHKMSEEVNFSLVRKRIFLCGLIQLFLYSDIISFRLWYMLLGYTQNDSRKCWVV